MRGKLLFVAGAAIGYVLGTKAGRQRYDDMIDAARKFLDSPSVHEATGVAQTQAARLYSRGKETLAATPIPDRLRHPMGGGPKDDVDALLNDSRQRMSSNSF
jgi:hypothetical protein